MSSCLAPSPHGAGDTTQVLTEQIKQHEGKKKIYLKEHTLPDGKSFVFKAPKSLANSTLHLFVRPVVTLPF